MKRVKMNKRFNKKKLIKLSYKIKEYNKIKM